MAQTLLTALIVACCAAYVLWALLLPAAARRRIATALLRWPWPQGVARHLRAQARPPSGCDCEGCDARPASSASGVAQKVHWAPRRKR
jgi:hypothetical protein